MDQTATYSNDTSISMGGCQGGAPRAYLDAMLRDYDRLVRENQKLKEEKDKAREEITKLKGQSEFAQNLLLQMVQASNSSDGDKKDVCELIKGYFNGTVRPKRNCTKGNEFEKTQLTFSLNIADNELRNKALVKAYNECIRCKFITKDSEQSAFIAIFSGEKTSATIKWNLGPGALAYFIKRLDEKNTITKPTGPGIWEVTKSHILDKNGNTIMSDLASQQKPTNKETLGNINDIVAIMEAGF